MSTKAQTAKQADIQSGNLKTAWIQDAEVNMFINALYNMTTV